MVMIGVDPHKRTHTAVAVDGREVVLGERLVQARSGQVAELVAWADEFDDRDRTWAVESAGGLGYLLSQQLLASATATPEPNNTLRPNLPPVDGPPKRARKPANNLLTNKEASICAEGSTAATTAACTPSGDGRTEVAGPRVSAMSARLRSRALNSRHQRPTNEPRDHRRAGLSSTTTNSDHDGERSTASAWPAPGTPSARRTPARAGHGVGEPSPKVNAPPVPQARSRLRGLAEAIATQILPGTEHHNSARLKGIRKRNAVSRPCVCREAWTVWGT